MNGILIIPLPRWEGIKGRVMPFGFSPPPLSSPIEGEEVVKASIRSPDLRSVSFTIGASFGLVLMYFLKKRRTRDMICTPYINIVPLLKDEQ